MKKSLRSIHIIMLTLTALFIFIQPVHASVDAGYTIFPANSNVSELNKKWTIKFNMPLNAESVTKDTVKVLDDDSFPININISYDPINFAIIASPVDTYILGSKYTLIVTQDVQALSGKKLLKPVMKSFITRSPSGIVNSPSDYYEEVRYALKNFEDKFTLTINNYDSSKYNLDVISKILDEHPDYNYGYTGAIADISTIGSKATINISINYNKTKSEMLNMKIASVNKADQIISQVIKPGMKDYEKEAVLHDFVINNARYDIENYNLQKLGKGVIPPESYTDYGILVNGIGVCEGYAKAMFRLLNAVGVECLYITGTANNGDGPEGHAWNIVKINNQYYHLDATWDDPWIDGSHRVLIHNYFNLSDDEISKDHSWDTNSSYPKCTSTDANFDKLNIKEFDSDGDLVLLVKDYSQFYNLIKDAILNRKAKLTLKILDYNSSAYNVLSTIKSITKYYPAFELNTIGDSPCYMKIYFTY